MAGTRLRIFLQTFWGTNSLWGFSMVGRRWEGDHGLLGAKQAYDVLSYSGLGDYPVSANGAEANSMASAPFRS